MSIFTKNLEEITQTDLEAVVEQKLAEWKTIEYKQTLVIETDAARKKFLSQVSSFANALGGR